MSNRHAIATDLRRAVVVGLCSGVVLISGCSASGHDAASPAPSTSAEAGSPAEQLATQSMPSWLPSQSVPGTVVGTVQKPALSYQGVEVKVNLDRGNSVVMNVNGLRGDRDGSAVGQAVQRPGRSR